MVLKSNLRPRLESCGGQKKSAYEFLARLFRHLFRTGLGQAPILILVVGQLSTAPLGWVAPASGQEPVANVGELGVRWVPTATAAKLELSSFAGDFPLAQLRKLAAFHSPYLMEVANQLAADEEAIVGTELKAALNVFAREWKRAAFADPARLNLHKPMWHIPIRHGERPYQPVLAQENEVLKGLDGATARLLRQFRFTVWLRTYGISCLTEPLLEVDLGFTELTKRECQIRAYELSCDFQAWHNRVAALHVLDRFRSRLQLLRPTDVDVATLDHFQRAYARLFVEGYVAESGRFLPQSHLLTRGYPTQLIDIVSDDRLGALTGIPQEVSARVFAARQEAAEKRSNALSVFVRTGSQAVNPQKIWEVEQAEIHAIMKAVEGQVDTRGCEIVQTAVTTHLLGNEQLWRVPVLIKWMTKRESTQEALRSQLRECVAEVEAELHSHFIWVNDHQLTGILDAPSRQTLRAVLVDHLLVSTP